MTNYKRGDIVLVDFGFSEGAGSKKRPSLIISSSDYHKSREEVILAAITSNTKRVLFGDTKINEWKTGGLICPSLATAIIRTIKASVIIRKLGAVSKQGFQEIKKNLKKAVGF